jgi:hypothetical protein
MTIFISDGFDYGNYDGWTTKTTNGALAVDSASAYQGSNYGLDCSTTGQDSTAVIRHTFTAAPIVYHRAYYRLNGMPASGGGARLVLGGIYDSGRTNSVNPCVRNIGGSLYWEIAIKVNGSITFTTETTASNPVANTWYCIEILRDLTNQTATVWVNGSQKVNVTALSQVNNSEIIEVGLNACDYSTPESTICYIDAVVAGDAYKGTTTYNLTIQQGTGGTTNPTNGVYTIPYSGKQETITATANSGYTFSHWNLDGSNAGSTNPYTITMNNNYTMQPVFTSGGSGYLTVTGNLTVNGTTTLNNTLDVSGIMNSHASGSSPVAGSNAGMIIDCYTPTHQDGLGIQSGGIWLKYDNNFNIYYDNGSSILAALALNTNGDATIAGAYRSNVSSSTPGPHTTDGLKIDLWPAAHSDGIGMQNGGMWLKYGGIFDIYYDSGTAITDALHLDSSGNMTLQGTAILYASTIAPVSPYPTVTVQSQFKVAPGYYTYVDYLAPSTQTSNIVTVESNLKVMGQAIFTNTIQHLTPQEIVTRIWHYTGATWDPQGLPVPVNRIEMSSIDGYTLGLFEIIADAGGSFVDPLLATNVGLVVQKDISCGGFVSSNQGEVWIGHGRNTYNDVPKIILSHAAASYGTDPLTGQSGFKTLYLRQALSDVNTPADLDLGNLTAHGTVGPDVSPTWNGSAWVNGRGLGSTSQFWNFVDSAYYFAKYQAFLPLDEHDDLAIVKGYKVKKLDNRLVIDLDSIPQIKADQRNDSVDLCKAQSLVLGCIKQAAQKLDEHQNNYADLLQRVEALENQLNQKAA